MAALSPSYVFFVENDYYCYAVSFTCKGADFSTYLPYFREWEGTTAVYEDNVEERILNETLLVETDNLSLTVPAEMWESEDPKWDLVMYSSPQISLWVRSLKKTEISDIFSLEDCIRKIFFEASYIDSLPEGLVTDEAGHTVFIDTDYNAYSVFLENGDKYIAVYFFAPDRTFDLYLPMFQEWGNKIVVKNASTAQQ
ncbi:MAG: hypothetical protein IJ357_05360 [Oscillospiraceae bacterium]|nr:hypothetical protein [Oscillospiraceae bacterium]